MPNYYTIFKPTMKLLISVVNNPHYNIVDNLWDDYIPVSLKEYMLERYEKILYKHIHLSCNIYICVARIVSLYISLFFICLL